jgi:hypothetical protein
MVRRLRKSGFEAIFFILIKRNLGPKLTNQALAAMENSAKSGEKCKFEK